MGTSHRHTATIKGEPNWGNASKALTSVASIKPCRADNQTLHIAEDLSPARYSSCIPREHHKDIPRYDDHRKGL